MRCRDCSSGHIVDQKPEARPGGARAATGIPQQPKNITTPLPYIGEDNVFYMIPPRDNTSYPGAFNEYYYDLPINHLPGIHWCAVRPMYGTLIGL